MHQQLKINVELVELQTVQAEVSLLNISDVAAAAYEPDSGYGSPPKTTIAFAKRAADLGVEVRTQTPVLEVKLDSQGRVSAVKTPAGEIMTRTVVDCVGPWARNFAQHLGLEFPVMPIVEHVVVLERPVEFSQPHPVISDLVNLCYFRSDLEQPYTRIGNSNPKYHSQFALANADDFNGQIFPGICEELSQKLIVRCPTLKQGKLVETYSGIWGVTPDYQPIIDKLEYVPGLYCAVGFSGHGYKLSPIVGELMSCLILGETNELVNLLKLFRLSRFQENDLVKSPYSYAQEKGLR